jgi:hypothetical protein
MRSVYFVEHTKWRHEGRPCSARQFSQHDVEDAVADRALQTGVAVPADSVIALTFRSSRGNGYGLAAPDRDNAIDLDDLNDTVAALRAKFDPRVLPR